MELDKLKIEPNVRKAEASNKWKVAVMEWGEHRLFVFVDWSEDEPAFRILSASGKPFDLSVVVNSVDDLDLMSSCLSRAARILNGFD